jgi:eukaryotic-like serine/threonine-protein kinase
VRPLVITVEDSEVGSSTRHAFLRSPVHIGRRADCDIVLPQPFVSARHGIVQFDEEAARYTDLDSRNGSSLDGRTLAPDVPVTVEARSGLRIGSLRLSFARGAPAVVGDASAHVRPGALTELMETLARTSEFAPGDAWARSLHPGLAVGRFELVREIGRGGFGLVFEARDRQLGRRVALKAMRPGEHAPGLQGMWLQREAEAAAQLNHPNIVTLFDLGSWEGGPYLIMELLRGEGLDARLARGPLPLDDALRVAIDVARALAHAHRAGVAHRDIKPSNVFLTDEGWTKVLDFGLAQVFGSHPPVSGGTPRYMAPEQRRHEPADARADVFSAALVLHETLTGTLPFEPGTLDAGLPTAVNLPLAAAPPVLTAMVARALSPDVEGRPRDGSAWLEGLLAAQREAGKDALR